MTDTLTAAAPAAARTAHVGDRAVELERPNAAKTSRAFAELRQARGAVEQLTNAYGEFVTGYEAAHVVELDRVQARMRYGRRPVLDEEGAVVRDDKGDLVMAPSPLDAMAEEDWQASGGKLRLPRSPDTVEIVAHLAPLALELAEDRVYRLLALFLMPNREVAAARKDGTLDQALNAKVDELLGDLFGDELVELAVACGEVIDHHFRRKVADLGGRLGNALRLVGMGPKHPASPEKTTTEETPSSPPAVSTPSSSIASPASTDGTPTSPSAPPSTSSSSSEPSSTPSATGRLKDARG